MKVEEIIDEKYCDFRSLKNVARSLLGAQQLHKIVARTCHHVDSRERSALNTEDLVIAIVSGKAVLLQVSQIGKWTDFCKV